MPPEVKFVILGSLHAVTLRAIDSAEAKSRKSKHLRSHPAASAKFEKDQLLVRGRVLDVLTCCSYTRMSFITFFFFSERESLRSHLMCMQQTES